MKKTYYLLFTILLAFSFVSCKKYLDIQPKGYVIPKTLDDFERILNGPDLIQYMPTELDMLSDDYYNPSAPKTAQNDNVASRVYLWEPNIYVSPSDLQYAPWSVIYSNIYQYNAIINNIDNATNGSDLQKKSIKAQALLGRGLSYWYLANLYAKQYNAQTASTDLGIPFVTSNDVTNDLPGRGTLQATYDSILIDVKAAIPDLPSSAPISYRMNKAAGYAALARIYLSMNNYALAAESASEILAVDNTLIDYNTVYSDNGDGTFEFATTTLFKPAEKNPENIFMQLYSYVFGMLYQGISKDVIDLLAPDDIRRMYLYLDIGPNAVDPSKNDTTFLYAPFIYTNIGFTVPEMLLTRAESNARLGKLDLALTDLNTLRKARIQSATYLPLASTDKKKVIEWVLQERRRELLFKGSRWFDMRRLSSDPDFGFTAKHYFADGTFVSLEPGSNEYMLAIPETSLNETIVQNPR